MKFKLLVDEYPLGYSKLSEHESMEAAQLEMIRLFDNGMHEDFAIVDDNDQTFYFPYHKLIADRCPKCSKEVRGFQMFQTRDCRGIPYRLVCEDCYDSLMEDPGYDGEYYDEEDECLDDDY